MLEIIFEDNKNTIRQEENFYFEGLLQRKFLYTHNQITKVFEYEYNDQKELIQAKEYDYTTYCQLYNIDFNKKRKRKERRI